MTQEEKGKAYDKVREKIAVRFGTNVAKEIFSEFEESKDERIRKALIEYFNEQCDMSDWNGVYGYQVVSWLEKQGQKLAWSEEDEHRVKDTIYFLDTAKKHYASTVELDACINWLKSLKERIGGE